MLSSRPFQIQAIPLLLLKGIQKKRKRKILHKVMKRK
jgi:hypothetical protein